MRVLRSSGAAGLLCAVFLSAASAGASAEIVLGHSGDLSGSTAPLTQDYVRGMRAYFDEVNKKGGVRGEKIKLVSLDDGFVPDRTVENTKALIDTHKAVALVGYRGTANLLKILPILEATGIPEIGNTSGAKSLRDPKVPGVFHLRASTSDEIEAAVNHAWTIGIRRIGVVYQDDVFGREGLDALNAALKRRSSVPVVTAPVPRGTSDVSAAVNAIAAARPQAVMMISQAKPNAAFIKAFREKGVSTQFFVLSFSSGLYAELGAPAAGVIVVQVVPNPFTEIGHGVAQEYRAVIADSANKDYSFNSMEGYLNAKLVVRALQKTPAPISRARLTSTLESFNREDLGGYSVTYGKNSNLGSRFVNLTMIRADGSFVH